MIRAGLIALALAGSAPLQAQALAAPAVQSATLAQQLDAIAAVPKGRVGIAAIDLATGREVAVHGDERFPMASVVKLAVAGAYLAEVDAGRRSLAKLIPLDERIRSGSDGIGKLMPHPGVTLEFGEPGRPVVVLVHDDHGRLPWLDQYALALARAGFHVLVPDLYDGRGTLDDGLAGFDCTVYREVEAGDHVLVLLQLHAVEQAEGLGSPLVFHRSGFGLASA